MIQDSASLQELLSRIQTSGERVCAVDTEADSLHRFKESLCLIQLSAAGENVLIDPLAIDDLSPFADWLNSCEVWMHGADYDMTMLKRAFGAPPPIVWDTQIGARLLGIKKFGLSDLVDHWFGVELIKTSQKADWGKRPLTEKMISYALNDVAYLLPMSECIVEELQEKNRYEWFRQSCEAARKKVSDRDEEKEEIWRINGSNKLSARGLAYLKALYDWRNYEAEQWDKPTFMVLTNKDMILWCETLATGGEIKMSKHQQRPDRLKRFQKAISEAKSMDEENCPQRFRSNRRKKDPSLDKEIETLLQKRDSAATRLQIEPSLIISRATAELLAAGEINADAALLPWQIEQLGEL